MNSNNFIRKKEQEISCMPLYVIILKENVKIRPLNDKEENDNQHLPHVRQPNNLRFTINKKYIFIMS